MKFIKLNDDLSNSLAIRIENIRMAEAFKVELQEHLIIRASKYTRNTRVIYIDLHRYISQI